MADNTIALHAVAPTFDTPFETAAKGYQLRALQNADIQQQQAMADDHSARAALQADPTMGQGYLASLAGSGNYKGYVAGQQAQLGAAKTRAETGHLGAQTEEAHFKAVNEAFTQHRDQVNTIQTPDQMAAWMKAGYDDPLMGPILSKFGSLQDGINKIPTDPKAFADFKVAAGLSADQYVKHTSVDANTLANNANAVKTTQMNNDTSVKTTQMNNDTSVKTTGMNNAKSTANVATQQAGENTRAGEANKTHLLAVGLDANGKPTADSQGTVDAIGQYKQAGMSGMALRSPRMASIMDQVHAQYPNYDAAEFPARQQAVKAFAGGGKEGTQVEKANTAVNHLSTLQQLADAQANNNWPLFNKVANTLAAATGKAAPTNLAGAITMVGPEISAAVVGAGGTGGDREKVDKALDAVKNGGPDQAGGQLATMMDLFGGRLTEKERTYERSTGRQDFRTKLLSPAAAAALDKRSPRQVPTANAQGWALHVDASGNKAYVSPDGKSFEEVK